MNRLLVFVVTVLLMLAAGIVLGRLSTRVPVTAAPTTGPAWFDEQLNLSVDQRKQMETIWGDVRQKMEKHFDRQRSLEGERDKAIKELLSEEQQAKYDAIHKNYREKRGEFDKEFSKLRSDADEKSRALLDEAQKKRWDELKQMRDRRRRGGGSRGPRGPSTQRSTTEPSRSPDGFGPRPQ